ncbi:MAG: HD domain-containing protein, partial [Candidatus Eisenbacteria bacterium]|nr:HD domain-containing protein [Candidatus Eisenbacteria bacterium]
PGPSGFEITTFRSDGDYSDARHPDTVTFSASLEDDLIRRDFTVNALAFDPTAARLVDLGNGLADLTTRTLRTVGDPAARFREDALRLLRAVRFAATLDFAIEPHTMRGIVGSASGIVRVAPERIRTELDRILELPRPSRAFVLLFETGLLRRILPELAACYGVAQNPHHAFDVFHHSLAALDRSDPGNPVVRLAALLHDVGKPETRAESDFTATFFSHQLRSEEHAERILRRLRYPNQMRDAVAHLVHHHMFHYTEEWTDAAVRRFLRQVGPDRVEDLFAMRAADTLGNGLRTRVAPELARLRERIDLEVTAANALSIRDLAVGGNDLMATLGLAAGPRLGRILNGLLEAVLEDPARNNRAQLLTLAETLDRELD